jgi:cytidylate kinase
MAAAPNHNHVIAIDGPAAAGKSTVARVVADRLGALLFDTGALYRAVALRALRTGVPPSDAPALAKIAQELCIAIRPPTERDGRLYDVVLDGEDVTWALRGAEVGAIVSAVAEHLQVRTALLPLQRRIAAEGLVVMVGRDIGTVVVPDAGLKVYLDASLEERARRRFLEISARGGAESFAAVVRETAHRDRTDSGRQAAPLRAAADAVRIDTESLDVAQVVGTIEELARRRGIAGAAVGSSA